MSLLPEWALPYIRFSIPVIAQTLKARLMEKRLWNAAAAESTMTYQRGQHWVRRFTKQAEALAAAMAGLTAVVMASGFVTRALVMLEKKGWIGAHRFRFAGRRMHLLGWGPVAGSTRTSNHDRSRFHRGPGVPTNPLHGKGDRFGISSDSRRYFPDGRFQV